MPSGWIARSSINDITKETIAIPICKKLVFMINEVLAFQTYGEE